MLGGLLRVAATPRTARCACSRGPRRQCSWMTSRPFVPTRPTRRTIMTTGTTMRSRFGGLMRKTGWSGAMRCELGVGGVAAHAVEEHTDLRLPPLQVGAQDRGLVGVGDLGRLERLGAAADAQLAGRRRPAGCAPTASRRVARRGTARPSRVSRLTGVVRHSPLVRPRTRSSREPHTLTPARVRRATDGLNTWRVNQPGSTYRGVASAIGWLSWSRVRCT